nr:retrovirus-related Pol polyprotein from transposon 17.6 [Tanacetum cinerariifolium]
MVKEGIVLGYKMSSAGIEVDKEKVDGIAGLPYPTNVKGAVLGQMIDKKFRPIYYASKTMNDAQKHYTTTEKELLAMVYDFDKFCSFLVMSKTAVYTDHSVLKYLFGKHDAKSRLIRLAEMRKEAYEHSRAYKEITKRWHDARITNKEFQKGEKVLVFNSRLKLFLGKLKTRWYGPYTVSKVFPYGTVEVTIVDKGMLKITSADSEMSKNYRPKVFIEKSHTNHYLIIFFPTTTPSTLAPPLCQLRQHHHSAIALVTSPLRLAAKM